LGEQSGGARRTEARLRKQGLRPVQMWVPDVRSKRFLRLAHLDTVAIARSRSESDDQAFVDSVSVWPNRWGVPSSPPAQLEAGT
jgi:hypothetical protein